MKPEPVSVTDRDRNSRSGTLLRAISVLLLLLFVYVVSGYIKPARRSITIAATTEVADLTLSEKADWRLGEAVVCTPISVRPTRASAITLGSQAVEDRESKCYQDELERSGRLLVRWPENAVIELSRAGLGYLQIQGAVPDDSAIIKRATVSFSTGSDEEIINGTRILVLPSELPQLGSLDFVGEVHVGSIIASGTQKILLDGEYEIREVFGIDRKSQMVRRARLMMGDKFVLHDDLGALKSASGFISVINSTRRGFDLLLSGSSTRDTSIKLERRGYDTTTIVPRWTERALTDGFGLGLTALLGFLLTIVAFIREVIGLKEKL